MRPDAGDIEPSPARYIVTYAHDHKTLRGDDVVIMTPEGKNLLIRERDKTLHELKDGHGQYVHLSGPIAQSGPNIDTRDVWLWQGDGHDHLESLTCQILIRPEQLRAIKSEYEQELEELRRKLRDIGEVFVPPAKWDSAGMGGPPAIDAYEKIDLAAL